jgi:hypothetical protein
MNELSKANEWEFWDYDVSASSYLHQNTNEEPKSKDCSCNKDGPSVDCARSHILSSHIEQNEDDVDKAWREFDSYESIMRSPAVSTSQAGQSQQVMPDKKTNSQGTTEIHEGPTTSPPSVRKRSKSLDSSRDKSQSPPRLNDVKSNCKGARAA